jgi:signal transduction histidine kinase
MNFASFTRKGRRLSSSFLVFILLIIVSSYSLFFYLQYVIEKDTKDRLFYQQIGHQLESTKKISEHISSDLDSVIVALHGLANSVYLQHQPVELSGDKIKKLAEETYSQLNTITVVERLYILDKNNTASTIIGSPPPPPQQQQRKADSTFSDLYNISIEKIVSETRTKLTPIFSNGFRELEDNKYKIAITYPILNRETREYIGTIAVLIPTVKFFEHYGNIHNINSQYLVTYDRNGTFLASPAAAAPEEEVVEEEENATGRKNFFANEIQQFIKYNKNLNDKVVLSGQPGKAIYDYGFGERLSTGYPILAQGKRVYSIFVVTPASQIYSQVNDVLFLERIEMFLLLTGTTVAVIFLIIFLHRWNTSLDQEVKRRTRELGEVNKRLRLANEQLTFHDKMQKEFIDIAAHELRTPLQPIISYNALASKGLIDKDESLRVIDKQARRLKKLTNDLLAVNRIESGNLPYRMEKIRINDLILDVVNSYCCSSCSSSSKTNTGNTITNNNLVNGEEELSIDTDLDHNIEEIDADKERIVEVLSNIINNAVKFTKKGGRIKIESHLLLSSDKKNKIEIKISDTGAGIPEDILPKIFDKFITKNILRKGKEHGSGLGLYISKAIVTAHNGEITAYNNDSGGATFTITLPINNNNIDDDDDNNNNGHILT